MNKFSLITFIALCVIGCKPTTENTTQNWDLPEDLADCTINKLTDTNGTKLTIVRCTNSTTSVSYLSGNGSTIKTTITIDGQKYVKLEK